MIHKTTRSILSVLLAVLLLVTSTPLTPAFAGDGGAVSPQSESGESEGLAGAGTEDDPYKIATAEELREFADKVNNQGKTDAWAELTDDIDLSEICSEEDGVSWTPIGNSSNNQYTGTFNGQNFKISGLYIKNTSSDTDDQGLFGSVGSSGKIENLTVSGSVNSSGDYVGGIVGWNNGNVINCAFSGSVSGNSYVGGVVGVVGDSSGSVKNCYNTGSVNGSAASNNVGGVVGRNDEGTVKNCYNTGSVNGSIEAGGVVGLNSGGNVENCYNIGEVSGGIAVGGVVGYNDSGISASASASVENCYNIGSVGDGTYTGGVVGYNEAGASVTGCYFLQDTAEKGIGVNEGNDSAEGAAGLTADQFKDPNSFTKWDFGTADTTTWTINPVLGRPVLNENKEGGDGSPDSPYEISTATQLETFRYLVNNGIEKSAHAKLMNDIDLNGNELDQWTPIGNSIRNSYEGTFNGDGHTISGLYIDSSDNDYKGLFGRVNGGTVQDLTVSGSVSGHWYVGGVVGYNDGGTVTGCIFSGSGSGTGVTGSYYVGGVVGSNNNGSVKNCYNTGKVSGSNTVGGVVGYSSGGSSASASVTNCYNTGSVNGSADSSNVGGVVGRNDSGTVENCYNTDSVSGYWYVGGVVGYNHNGGSVTNSYNTGTVSGGDGVGGVVGQNFDGTVENCYNIGDVSGNYVGGVVGENINGSITNCYYQIDKGDIVGIGNETTADTSKAEGKTDAQFASGEVAYLLQSKQTTPVWGQSNLTTGKSWPTLVALDKNAQTVYKVITDYGYVEQPNNVSYTNNPATPSETPSRKGYTFGGWQKTTGEGNTITYTAKWTAEEPPYTGKYSYEVFTSVGDNGAISVDRYATEGDKVTIDVTPDQAYKLDDLTVTAHGKDVELTANSDGTYTFTMPSADVKISATFAEDPDWTEPEEPATDVSDLFSDIAPDAWYKDAVQYAYDNGLMTGVSANEFAPEQTTTRAMIVSILARLEGVESAEAAGFADVTDEWYATAVNWAANVGVVNGYEDNTFKPNTAITREQLAAILMNYAAYKGYDVSARADLSHYSDADSISSWANDVLLWAVAEGLLTGVTDDTIAPQAHATRAQVAAILQRFLSE